MELKADPKGTEVETSEQNKDDKMTWQLPREEEVGSRALADLP